MTKLVGQVIKGRREGRKLGYPTANLKLISGTRPRSGIYSAWTKIGEIKLPSILICGVHLEESGKPRLEVYILDFSGDLYGQELSVKIGKKIRDVIPFSSSEQMVKQIEDDVALARQFFSLGK